MAWIRSRVPIADVAGKLGLEVIGKTVRCWRPDKHQHGDRTPSVGLDGRRNKLKCFVCDERQISNIDLVMQVKGYRERPAALWIATHFDVPLKPKGARLATGERWHPRYLASISKSPISPLIRSCVWAALSPTEQSVVTVLLEFTDEFDECSISYGGLTRYTGIGSDTTIRKALKSLQDLHVIEAKPGRTGTLRDVGCYRLTLESPELLALVEETHATAQRDISLQREIRDERRQQIRRNNRVKLHTSKNEASPEAAPAFTTGIKLSSKNEVSGNKTLQILDRVVESAATVEEHTSKNGVSCCTAPTNEPAAQATEHTGSDWRGDL